MFCKYLKSIIEIKKLIIIKKEENYVLIFRWIRGKIFNRINFLAKGKKLWRINPKTIQRSQYIKRKNRNNRKKDNVKNENIIKELKNDNEKLKEEIINKRNESFNRTYW